MNTLPFVGPMPQWSAMIFCEPTGAVLNHESRFGWDDSGFAPLDAPVWLPRGSVKSCCVADLACGSQITLRPGLA